MRRLVSAWIVLSSALATSPARAEALPIIDVHMHYSRAVWDVFTPAQVIAKMDNAGVIAAVVSSTPDDGTFKLRDAAPDRFVAGYRPYENSGDIGRWFAKAGLLAYSEKRLVEKKVHRVFGEIHISHRDEMNVPEIDGYLSLAMARNLYFHTHSDATVVAELFWRKPSLKVIWAHAGMSDPAPVVAEMLDRHANLWAELSYRAHDILPADRLDPEWEKLLIRHADRFVVGTDTWAVDRWESYEGLIAEHRAWLGKLPRDVAEKIAHKNARRLLAPTP